MLTAKDILNVDDLPRVEVPVPEWSGSVYVRALTGRERDQLERMYAANNGPVTRAAIVALCTVDKDGARLFTDDDVEALSAKNGAALERIVSAALSHNFMTSASLDEAGND